MVLLQPWLGNATFFTRGESEWRPSWVDLGIWHPGGFPGLPITKTCYLKISNYFYRGQVVSVHQIFCDCVVVSKFVFLKHVHPYKYLGKMNPIWLIFCKKGVGSTTKTRYPSKTPFPPLDCSGRTTGYWCWAASPEAQKNMCGHKMWGFLNRWAPTQVHRFWSFFSFRIPQEFLLKIFYWVFCDHFGEEVWRLFQGMPDRLGWYGAWDGNSMK